MKFWQQLSCLFIHLLTIIGNGSPCFSHVGEVEPELSTSYQEHGWLIYATKQPLERRPDTVVGGGVFRLSGVRVVRGEQTPWGIQCHLLFVCPCRNQFRWPSDGKRSAALILCMQSLKCFEFGRWLRQKDCMTANKTNRWGLCVFIFVVYFKSNFQVCHIVHFIMGILLGYSGLYYVELHRLIE